MTDIIIRLRVWWQTSRWAKPTLIIIVIFLIITIISFLIIPLINSNNGNLNSPINVEQNLQRTVNTASFENSTNFELLDPQSAINSDIVYFSGRNYFYSSENLNINLNGSRLIANDASFSPTSIYQDGPKFIINEFNRSLIYDTLTTNLLELPNKVRQITPTPIHDDFGQLNKNGFTYLQISGFTVFIRETESFEDFTDSKLIGNTVSSFMPEFAEIKVIGNHTFVIVYEKINKQGRVEFWQINPKGQGLTLNKGIVNLQFINFQNSIIIYTLLTSDQTKPYDTFFMKATKEGLSDASEINISNQLENQEINGNLLAHRCSLRDEMLLYCLVKKDLVGFDAKDFQDEIIIYNINNSEISFPFQNLNLSAHRLYFNEQEVYFLSQLDNLIYRINN